MPIVLSATAGGQGPGYDGRLYTPYENQDLVTFHEVP